MIDCVVKYARLISSPKFSAAERVLLRSFKDSLTSTVYIHRKQIVSLENIILFNKLDNRHMQMALNAAHEPLEMYIFFSRQRRLWQIGKFDFN